MPSVQNAPSLLGTHNPFNNLWTESVDVLIQSERFAKNALKHIPAKKPLVCKKLRGSRKAHPK